MKTVSVEIKGTSPLLMHAYPLVEIQALDKKTPGEQADYAAYRNADTQVLYVPATAVQRGLVGAAKYSKGKGRASLQQTVAACVMVSPDCLSLGVSTYTIDSRRVVIPATKGSCIRHRPRFDEWDIAFDLSYDEHLMTDKQLRKVLDDLGTMVGLLDYRPERKGPFGRFMVVSWHVQ